MEQEESYFDYSMFNNHKEIHVQLWEDMVKQFEIFPFYNYYQVDKLKTISGYNLCNLKDGTWNLWKINLDIKTGLYKIITDIIPDMKGFESIVNNNFIFCINGELYEYIDKKNKDSLLNMAKDIHFQITRLTIVEKMKNEVFKKFK